MAATSRRSGAYWWLAGYTPIQFSNFSLGLNLRDKADAVQDAEAIDLLNVDFTERGAIKQRDGYADLTGSALTNFVDSMDVFYSASGTRQLIAGCGTRLEAISTAGAVVASQTGLTGGPYTFARFAAPGSEFMYCANGSDTTQRWSGAAWTSGAASATVNGAAAQAMPKAGSVCVTAALPGSTSGTNAANRLIATAYGTGATSGPGGTASNPSRVHFSNPGLPETWETDGTAGRGKNFVDVLPGDGEQIMAAVTWRELVFIFKESKFAVLWGEGQQSDGTPTFSIREVIAMTGLAGKLAVCVGRDGVYFMARNGVYLTNGGEPQLVSDKIRPIWTQDPEVYFKSSPLNLSQIALSRMAWHNEQVYVAIPTGAATANDKVLVYDIQHQWWSLYDLPASALCSFRRSDQPELHFGYSATKKKIAHLNAGSTTDQGGVTITSRWRSGWGDYGSSVRKTIRESKVWASGAITVSFSTDFQLTPLFNDTALFGVTTTWPTSGTWSTWIAANNGLWPGGGQINDVLVRRAVQGTTFSTQFANNAANPTWSVHRVARHLREQREPSIP